MKQHNKNLTLNKQTLTNLQKNNIKGGFVTSIDLPCFTLRGKFVNSCTCEA
jgi:hypothetical protein